MPSIFQVGGCVRDAILGVKSKDIDFVFVLDDTSVSVREGYDQMKRWLLYNGYTIFLETPDMFTIRGRFPKDHKNAGMTADFVMARKEVGYVEGTRNPILEVGNLMDDLMRRDFTVNAMAMDDDENIIDPFGGINDLGFLGVGLLRTPLPAEITMMDDPLRILRAMRFSVTKGFTISNEIILALKNQAILEKLAKTVSAERIRDEVYKMMEHNTVESIERIMHFDTLIPGFAKLIFSRGLWLKPTFEKR